MSPRNSVEVLDEIAREQLHREVNLMPGLLSKIASGSRNEKYTKRKYSLFALAIAAALLIVLSNLSGVASALRGLIGYIPGVGRVDQSAPLRVLAGPVTSEREGYTITIDSAVLDAAHTVLNYRVLGQFPSWSDPMYQPRMCMDPSFLRLPDGSTLIYPSRTRSTGGGESSWQDIFPALPAQVNQAVLVLPCLGELRAGEGPTDWEIPLAFAPAPPEMTVFPVVEPPVQQSTPLSTTSVPADSGTTVLTPTAGWQLTVDGAAALDEGIYLQAALHWEADSTFSEVEIFPDAVHVYDAMDREVPAWTVDSAPSFSPAENRSLPLNLQTMTVSSPGPARLVLDYVGVRTSPFAIFSFDVGSSPQPGQKWAVNQELQIDGRSLRIVSAEYVQTGANEPALLMLYLESDSGILSVIARDKDRQTAGSAGSPAGENVPFRAGWYYENGFPEGQVTVEISSVVVRKEGPWQVTWMPPAGTAQPAAQPRAAGVCDDAEVQQLPVSDLPAGTGGRVLITESGENFDLFISNLDGSGRTAVGNGLIPDLSPDGKRLVFRGIQGGLYIVDVDGGSPILLTSPVQDNVYHVWPKWSPDGQQIAFDRVIDHQSEIDVMNADGSGQRVMLASEGDESLLGWAPDGQQIIYRLTLPEHISVRVFDIATGQQREAALLPLEGIQISLSPDAKRIVFLSDRGLFLQAMDGSDPILLRSDSGMFSSPVWSPDGQWILLAYLDGANNATAAHILLQPESCQLVRFNTPLGAMVNAWIKE